MIVTRSLSVTVSNDRDFEGSRSKDILGRAYEYFLGQFAGAEGKRGGEFYTPRSVVRVLVEMLDRTPAVSATPAAGQE